MDRPKGVNMMPEIGDIVYAYQSIHDRAGETMFLMSTQEHITTDPETGLAEALEEICRTGEMELIDGEYIEAINQDDAKNLVVWKMQRIR